MSLRSTPSCPNRKPTIALVAAGVFALLSFAGYLAFVASPNGATRAGLDAASLSLARSLFAQIQIVLSAALLLFAIGPLLRRTFAKPLVAVFFGSWLLEAVGQRWGLPFGSYRYEEGLGFLLPGGVPWTIPASWATGVLAAHLLVRAWAPRSGRFSRMVAVAFLVLAWDLALDPAMSTLNGFWTWTEGGLWYGVPISNLVAWCGAGAVFATLLEWLAPYSGDATLPSRHWLAWFWVLLCATPAAMLVEAGMGGGAAACALLSLLVVGWVGRNPSARPIDKSPVDGDLDFMGRNSKSFRFATLFLSDRLQGLVAGVYGWCRVSDDLVDEARGAAPETLRMRLDDWEGQARMAYEGRPCGIPLVDRVFVSMREADVPFVYARELLEGLRMDIEPRFYCNEEDLRAYSYRVASVIGIWLARMVGVRDPWVLERAEALGHAMQLTNILRDVGDDLRLGRVYLPLQDLMDAGITEQDLKDYASGARPIDTTWRDLMERLIARADRDYALAYEGIPHLPWSFRIAVAVAASVYQGIHGALRRHAYDNFRRRAVVGPIRKIGLAFLGLGRLAAHLAFPVRQSQQPALRGAG